MDESENSKIAKHAELDVASNPNIPFPVDRMDFEHEAWIQTPGQIPADENIQTPELRSYHAEQRLLNEMMKEATENDGR